jgi:hypothetical protein
MLAEEFLGREMNGWINLVAWALLLRLSYEVSRPRPELPQAEERREAASHSAPGSGGIESPAPAEQEIPPKLRRHLREQQENYGRAWLRAVVKPEVADKLKLNATDRLDK